MAFGIAPVAAATPEYPVARVDASRISEQDRAERRGEVNAGQAAIQSRREPAPTTTDRQTLSDAPATAEARPRPLDFSDEPRPSAIETDAAARAYAESQSVDDDESASERLLAQRAVQSYQDSPATPSYVVDLSR